MSKKHILFLSANDFKEKSIQVLRKTPEAFVNAGWKLTYIVARDYSTAGNYYYEKEINIEGVDIIRFPFPFTALRNKVKNHLLQTIITQLAGYLTILKLYSFAKKELKKNKVDVIYGYEVYGICSSIILRKFGYLKNIKIVSRFQGTWVGKYLKEKKRLKLLLNFDDVIALKSKADLSIMTNDGTFGDYAMKKLNSKALHNLKFWINGVDEQKINESEYQDLTEKYREHKNKLIVLSISRLEEWKRVDRGISAISYLVNKLNFTDIVYFIIGEGGLRKKYEELVEAENISNNVIFVGGIPNTEVKKYLNFAEIFFSTYDLSNVGNPLLEAIRANKIIFTLNNGDTSSWIKHKENGFIYDISDELSENMANDLYALQSDNNLKIKIKENIIKTENKKLWTWQERFNAEVKEVEALLKQ